MGKLKISIGSREKVAALALAALLILAAAGFAAYKILHPRPLQITIPLETVTEDPVKPETFRGKGGYFPAVDGLFYPESGITRTEAENILRRVTGLPGGADGDELLNEESFSAVLEEFFTPGQVREAVECIRALGSDAITRAEAAVCFNRLFGLSPAEQETGYYPDVSPAYWAWGDIVTAAEPSELERVYSDFFLRDGWLYCTDENGYCIKNAYKGSLYFGCDGRYSSGNAELDGYVSAAIAANTDASMTRQEMLRSMYDYVREAFTYRIRHYYEIGDLGWAMDEALTMYSTGKGNCYCYAGAFWAAARGLGYDAKIVSGTYGKEESPHGWVEIIQDGERLIYDVEIEMSYRREQMASDMFGVEETLRNYHGYIEAAVLDEAVPRRTSNGVAPK